MEVKDVGQGRQLSLGFNTSSDVLQTQQNADVANKTVDNKFSNSENVNEKDVKRAVDKINKLMEDTPTHLRYEVYGKFKDIMVSIVDNNTDKVIKEIPPKSIVDMVDKLCELAGVFLDKKV
ncbi:flagellar protein FlaG [Clostridium coskatii]|uniref:Flagellar protein FlaG n=1 Tax=Clostridium coskatii TaxID=1705578 RepID=A0A166TG76_9CLOT|nr:flagellar protein FlaG [Clostridium coskatii]OAA93650.1 flagellar protein FlaG [Clostridium coskatii]OBR89988.1 flagellar protein FlaG [Clostridium coskatii]